MNKRKEARQKKMAIYKIVGCSVAAAVILGMGYSHFSNAAIKTAQDKAAVNTLKQSIKSAQASAKETAQQDTQTKSISSTEQMQTASSFVLKYLQALPTINSEEMINTINNTYLTGSAKLYSNGNFGNDKNSYSVFGSSVDDLTASATLPNNGKIQVFVTSASVKNVTFSAEYDLVTGRIDQTNTYGLAKN